MNTSHIYTDGSILQEAVGYGVVYGHDFKDAAKAALPREASIFTAELSAILKALSIIRNSIPLSWTVFSDSQAAIQAIAHPNPKHPLVRSIQSLLIELQNLNKKISFCKVPSHVGVRGNEAADKAVNDAQKNSWTCHNICPTQRSQPPNQKELDDEMAIPQGPRE